MKLFQNNSAVLECLTSARLFNEQETISYFAQLVAVRLVVGGHQVHHKEHPVFQFGGVLNACRMKPGLLVKPYIQNGIRVVFGVFQIFIDCSAYSFFQFLDVLYACHLCFFFLANLLRMLIGSTIWELGDLNIFRFLLKKVWTFLSTDRHFKVIRLVFLINSSYLCGKILTS